MHPTGFKGISHFTCIHHILLEEKLKSTRKMQRRLNRPMIEEVKAEILNLKVFASGLIQPIRIDPLGLVFQNNLNICKPKFWQSLMNN